MSATSGGGGSVSEGSEAGGSSQSTMSVGDSPSTSFQTNLTENVTKITLSEENSTGGFGPGVTGSKINLSMDERQQKDGIVNVAFDYEEDANRGNGDFKSINGSEKKDKVPEAVNLELVNMVPYSNGNGTSYGVPVNGIPTKKDSEQMDMSTPYDEYFVPVNEHKKYMRGEKLYVTKDKRRPTSWRRCLSWIVACTVISVVLILAILAGTGVILSQEPDLVKEASVGRNFGGSNSKQSVTNKSLTPTAEMYMYVPRSIESEFVIDNLDFDPAFKDANSTAYKQFAASMEDQLKMLLFNKETLEFGASDVGLRVVNVSNDPFKVNYRIGWNYKQGINNPPEPIKMEDVKRRLVESLTRNQGYIDKYHIDREAIKVNRVINTCQMENGGCSHICYYNYISQQFVCTCPTHLVLDSSGKNCVAWTGSSEEDALPVPSQTAYPGMPYESTVNPVRGYETGAGYEHAEHGGGDHHKHKSIPEPAPEPTAEPSPEHDGSSGIYNEHGDHSSRDSSDHGGAPEPTAEPDAGNKYPHDYHDMYSEYESGERGAKPEPTAEENPIVKDHSTFIHESKEHEPSSEPSAGHSSEGRGHDQDGHSVYGYKDHSGESEPGPEPTAEPTLEGRDHGGNFGYEFTDDGREPAPEPVPGGDSANKKHYEDGQGIHVFKANEPSAEPTPEPSVEGDSAERHEHNVHSIYSSTAPQPAAEGDSSASGHDQAGHSVFVSKDYEPSAEPTPEPTADGDSNVKSQGDSIYGSVDHEPSAEPTPEPTGDKDSHVKVHGQGAVIVSKDHEPSAEPTPEPTATGDSDTKSSSHSIYGSKDHDPSAESTPEPITDEGSNAKSQGHSVYESVDHEPAAEPTPEPTANEGSGVKVHGQAGVIISKDHEPSAEPTPEPKADEDSSEQSHGDSTHGKKDHEPSAEPTPEPTAEGEHSNKNPGHVFYGSKDHVLSAEPTPEPTAEGDHTDKIHDSVGHSLHEFNTQRPTSEGDSTESVPASKEHEPSAEPTPEPVAETDSETKDHGSVLRTSQATTDQGLLKEREPSGDSEGDHDQRSHSIYKNKSEGGSTVEGQDQLNHTSKDRELFAEPTPEPIAEENSTGENHHQTGHSIYVSEIPSKVYSGVGGARDQERHEPISGEAAEDSGDKSHQQSGHSIYELKTPSKGGSVIMTHDQMDHSTSKDHDSSAKETPDSNADSKAKEPGFTMHTFHGSNAEGISTETTGTSAPVQNSMVPGDQSTSSKTKPEVTEDSKLHSISAPGADQSRDSTESFRGDKSQLPETTINPLPAQGIVNSGQFLPSEEKTLKTEYQTELPRGGAVGQNEPDKKHRVPYLEDILIRKPSSESENTTEHSQNPLENVKLTQDGKPVIEEVIIDDSGRNSASTHPSTTTSHLGNETNPDWLMISKTHHITVGDSSQGSVIPGQTQETSNPTDHPKVVEYSSASFPSGETETHMQTPGNPTDGTTAKNKGVSTTILTQTVNPTQEKGPVTMHPETHFDHTIPVFVGSPESVEANTEAKPTRVHATPADQNPSKPSIMETDHMVIHSSTGGFSNEGQTDRKTLETGTELPASATLMTILTPEGVEKITGQRTKNMESKEPQTSNKTINMPENEQEGNETTKSPEDISNNIKDELSENEEFNTLIEKDYKTTSSDGKEGITKYPNKSIKTEKKKIKDYPKGEKVIETTGRPAVTPEDFILQKHVNGNENNYDLDYSIQNEHTTKQLGGVTIADPHDGIPGVSFKPHGINNHDISILQTVAPDFRTETVFLTGDQELETLKPDSRTKFPEKEGESPKSDKDYPKFDKDYKYEKQKVSKKKDIKKKVGGKDGKNVELDDGRRYFSDIAREDLDVSQEDVETTMNPSFEKITVQPEFRTGSEVVHEYKVKNSDVTLPTGHSFGMRTDTIAGATELPGFKQTKGGNDQFKQTWTVVNEPMNRGGEINQETITGTSVPSPGTVYDGQFSRTSSGPRVTITNFTTPGTVFDGTSQFTTSTQTGQNTTFVHHTTGLVNSTTAHPTIIIHGQSGSLQDGHSVRFSNSTFLNPGNVTVVSVLNGTLPHSFTFTNYTFPNGSAVNPTIVIRGQSGTLQDGHQARFGNITFVTKNSNVYRIENETLPGTVFDGHFNPRNGHYHMYTNSSGTFVYTNASNQPAFVIKGESGDFGNSTAYFLENNTRTTFPGGFVGPQSVIFRNSTVFAVGSDATGGVQEITVQPHELMSNETIRFTNQMSPSFISSGTAYKVNDYFGYTSKCAAGQFQCVNGTSRRGSACISLSSKCDSISDCSDGSDELGCIENGCPGNFQCADGTCLKRNLVCNGIVDCSDGSDEKNCEKWKCEFDEFQCPSGRCIPVVWQCDGKPDCENHTDEYNCQTSCGNDEYLCPEGWCVPLTYKCNGVKECSNGEDEQLCDCSHEEFKCQTGGCVSTKQVCDGLDDCPDRSDEWDCVKLEPDSNLLKIRSASGDYEPVCADGWSSRFSDEVCASLGYFSSVPIENESSSSISTDSSFYLLKNDTTADFNKKIIVNLKKSRGNCSSGKLVEISCQEFSCGSRSMTDSSSVEARLVGGMSAASGQWPSVSLLYNTRNFHSCTANVLTPRWVLASYNCLKMGNKNLNEQDWKFFGGSTVFEAERENAETRKILRIIPHPQVKFNQFLFSNDMALVELDQSLQFTSNLGAVCLPEQEIQPRQICVTAGWGMNGPEDKAMRQQLQYLPVPTMNLTECNSTDHYSGFITDDKICAGYNSAQKSLCYNEEGAPLMCVNDRGEWELQGVLSYHSNCGRGSHPSIFSSITPVSDWIKKTIGNNFDRKPIPVTNR